MADVQSAAQWLGRLLIEEANYLSKVDTEVKELIDELNWMQCFLRDADESQYDSVMARRWVAQIRELTYEAEDMIEKYLVRVNYNRRGRGDVLTPVKKFLRIVLEIRLVHQVGSGIDTLKRKISHLTSKLHTYGIQIRRGESLYWLSRLRRNTYICYTEKDIIGRDAFMATLVDQLVNDAKRETRVFSIHGQGGVGKTFVAKKIFHLPKIRRKFDAFAWAYISQPCQSSAVQQHLLSSLTTKSKEQIAQMVDYELTTELSKVQCKYKCLIVLDGIWSEDVWNSLKKAFPFESHQFKSKLLITNRKPEVARYVHKDASMHPLKCLEDEDCRKLLDQKAKDVPVDISDVSTWKNKMLAHCEGLPLAISMLGGVLATKKTVKEWEKVHEDISSYEKDDHQVPKWRRILELSYYELPYQLKPSFLYLGYFPTNLEIPTKKIIRLWEAEGLVFSGDDEISEDTLEYIGESCLAELVERSLVQVGSTGLTGRVKTCIVHDLMRELCMAKGSQGNLLSIVQFGAEDDQSKPSRTSPKHHKSSKPAKKKFRRLAIYYSSNSGELPSSKNQAKFIRSLLFFNTLASVDVLIPLKKMLLIKAFETYTLLRVLDIEYIDIQKLPEEVGNLIHLRYLSLRGSSVSRLPSTVKNLRCLQVLDLSVLSFVRVRIPNVLWRMERLIHLFLPSNPCMDLHEDKIKLSCLEKLETLSNFSNICRAEDVAELKSLRRFSSRVLSDGKSIEPLIDCSSSKLQQLEHVSLRLEGQILKGQPKILEKCAALRKLWVNGDISESIESGMFPNNLVQLSLCGSKFQEDPMHELEKLPLLKKLSLEEDSYVRENMKCSRNGFPKLTHLTFKGLKLLKDWTVEKTALEKLLHLEIHDCQKLQMIPEGLEYVKSLQEMEISYMPLSFFDGWHPKETEKWVHFPKVKHIPYVKIFDVLDLQEVERQVNISDEGDLEDQSVGEA